MRWVLAGIAFALLVTLAVLTVAIKARNLAARARIAAAEQRILALRVEKARRQPHLRKDASTAELLQRYRAMTRTGGGQ